MSRSQSPLWETLRKNNADQKEFKKEVVTKLLTKNREGWKITHFHSSIHNMQ